MAPIEKKVTMRKTIHFRKKHWLKKHAFWNTFRENMKRRAYDEIS